VTANLSVLPRKPRVVFEDDALPHQIRLVLIPGNRIAVSCTCLHGTGKRGGFKPLESRTRWEPGTDLAVWRAHVEAVSGP
jgi:hypothetical protein